MASLNGLQKPLAKRDELFHMIHDSETGSISSESIHDNASLSFSTSSSDSISDSVSRSSSLASFPDSGQVNFGESLTVPTSSLTSESKSPSAVSLVTIPSHQTFRSFIHRHEIPRKILHISIGFITLWLYTQGFLISQITPVLTTMFIIIGGTDLIRFRNEHFNKFYVSVMGFLMREKEVNSYNGVIWYLLGLILVFVSFQKDICLLAVLLLSWADTAASTIGRAYGHLTPKIGNKSLAGSSAAFLTGVMSTLLLYGFFIPRYNYFNAPGDILWSPETSLVPLWVFAIVTGAVASLSEAIDIVDDNFSIPVFSSMFMWTFIRLTSTGSYESSVFA
ncbi:Dgk1p [Sugiyamaella lignohabitans]|uniref:Dgk1p n=1 Tax=Sugiyamaella lignohabitans TaxID=796027 RepID=A0A167FRQ4_9ASCO|nr:Dgk1p [Sugiyamaella lignohabitans]ANB15618.1 Dgk1p [Sugiyamaella lignohabitans]